MSVFNVREFGASSGRFHVVGSMSKSKISVVEAESEKFPFLYRFPLKFGGRVVNDVTVFRAVVTLEEQSGKKKAHGIGEMTMGTAWAWPTTALTPEMALRTIVVLAERIVAAATSLVADQHPLHLAGQLKPIAKKLAEELAASMKLTEPIPDLSRMSMSVAIYRIGSVRNSLERTFRRSLLRRCPRSFSCTTWSARSIH